MSPEHEAAIRERASRYAGLAARLSDDGSLPGHTSGSTATTIGLAASLLAADTATLLAELADDRAAHAKTCANFEEAAERWAEEGESPTKPSAWARLELFGHQQIIGRVREVTCYGVLMVEVAVPARDGYPAQIHHYAGAAIFGVHPLTEAQARSALEPTRWPSAIDGNVDEDDEPF